MLNWIEINSSALLNNYQVFLDAVGHDRCAPVLKSNAYGHGLAESWKILSSHATPPKWICTNYVSEATELRKLGFAGRILVVGPAVEEEFREAIAARCEITVGNFPVLNAWIADVASELDIHLKIDTGMSRQGFLPEDVSVLREQIKGNESRIKGISTHFANVEDVTEHNYADLQMSRFENAIKEISADGLHLIRHAASSASTLLLEQSILDLDRIGISLYGFWPSKATRLSYLQNHGSLVDLQPVLSWKTKVSTVKKVKTGDFIGYGCTYRAIKDMNVAVLPVGYYEGYPRIAGDHPSYVLIKGNRCPLVGRICMNMMVVDVSHLDQIEVGDEVTLIGRDGEEILAAEDLAAWAGTIHYEAVSRLNPEIQRKIV